MPGLRRRWSPRRLGERWRGSGPRLNSTGDEEGDALADRVAAGPIGGDELRWVALGIQGERLAGAGAAQQGEDRKRRENGVATRGAVWT